MTKNMDFFSNMSKYQAAVPIILRVVVGIFFILHGMGKIFGPNPGMEGFTGMITGMLGLPAIFAYLVAYGEFIGGIMLIIGFLTRYWAIYLSIIMIVAAATLKLKNGLMAAELDLTFLAVLVSLFFMGAGKCSLDHKIAHCKKKKAKKN